MDELANRLVKLSPAQRERLSAHIRSASSIRSNRTVRPLPRDGRKFRLSSGQERLWLLQQIEPENPAYNVAGGLVLSGHLDEAALEASLSRLVDRHETLRTTVVASEDGPWQIVHPKADTQIQRYEIDHPGDLAAHAAREAAMPFDLEHELPIRARLLRTGENEHVLLLTLHHIACDGWSFGVLLREWSELYNAVRARRAPSLPPLPVQYADYAMWQREWMQGQESQRQWSYWREQLAGMEPLVLPADHSPGAQPGYRGGRIKVRIESSLREKLEQLSRQSGTTLFTALLAAFQLLLHRYGGQRDIAVGTPVAGRQSVDIERLIGFFVNTVVLRTNFDGNPRFSELLGRVREIALGAFSHQDVPFEQLVAQLETERSAGRSPLFQVMLAYQNIPPEALTLEGLEWKPLDVETGTAKYDLMLGLGNCSDGSIEGALEYALDRFKPQTAERMARHWLCLLENVAAEPEKRIGELPLMGEAERTHVLEHWNRTEIDSAPPNDLSTLWERQVERSPDRIAVEGDQGTLSFRELDRLANGIAHRLVALGVGREVGVGVYAPRGERVIAAILGVWKAGGVWVPLDPAVPALRLQSMADDAGLRVVIFQEPAPLRRVALLDLNEMQPDDRAPRRAADPGNAAYIIHTSGSTGRPKGVVGTHQAILNRFEWMWRTYPFAGNDVVAQKTALAFVDVIWEIFGPLLSGIRLAIVPEDIVIDPPRLVPFLQRHEITNIVLVPSLLRLLLDSEAFGEDALPALRHWTASGEALSPALVRRLRAVSPNATVLNLYGSSEVAADSTCCDVSVIELELDSRVPIGKPISNTRLYVLDSYGNPSPAGIAGELHIGGAGVARGYCGDPELTALRFVPDPFARQAGGRLYRTGDVARWLASGELELLGRCDFQVKIRGMRIEPDEIRACIESHPAVREAAVVLRTMSGDGAPSLVAYVAPAQGETIRPQALRRHLRERVPEYMVPGVIVVLERLPLTRSGKVDRQGLPEPVAVAAGGAGQGGEGYSDQTEEIVAGIWGQVLGRAVVGRKENFFELGGHSLLATQVMARLRKALGVELALRALFEAPTVAGLSRRVRAAGAAAPEARALEPVRREGPLPASSGQQRLWFLQQLEPASAYYNCPGAVRLRGALDADALEGSLRALLERHQVLRTRYRMQEGELVQVVGASAELQLRREACAPEALGLRVAAEARQRFDLARELPLRALLLGSGAQEWVLVLTLHHIAADGWSMRVLVRELSALYGGQRLAPLPLQYGDYAVWERARAWEGALAYWKQRLAGMAPALELATDHARPAVRSHAGAQERLELSAPLSERIGQFSRQQGVSEYMTLLAGLAVVLWRYSGQGDIAVGTALGGREREELEELIGLFINTVVVRLAVAPEARFSQLLAQVREEVLSGQQHGGVPFERVVEAVQPQRSLRQGPLAQVMFLYEGQVAGGGPLQLAGVECEEWAVDTGTAKFDLTLGVSRQGGRLTAHWEYSRELWEPASARRMLESWVCVLESALAEPQRPLWELAWVSAREREQVIAEWNHTQRAWEGEANLVWWVHRQGQERPDAIAVEVDAEGEQLSYAELWRRAANLAGALRERGLRPEERVGVCTERGSAMVVAVLGVLQAGGAYVPLEPVLPGARLHWMLEDTGARIALTDAHGAQALAHWPGVRLDIHEHSRVPPLPRAPSPPIHPQQLAYVIYTSGSTGQPKGVGNIHEALVNRLLWMQHEYRLEPGDGVLHKTPFGFDVSVWELFWPLMAGGRLVIAAPEAHKDAVHLAGLIARSEVTTLHFVPSMLRAFLEVSGIEDLRNLRRVIASGEALSPELKQRFYTRIPATLHNLYGPTEAAIDVTYYQCPSTAGPVVPIGRPIANIRMYVLDGFLQPVAPGVPGHLHIAGVGLARGYERRPDLTAESFVPDPLARIPGARMYRTGDLARWLPDGQIEYLGRHDHQVKIRGVRVELGEIEAALLQHEDVRQAVVTAFEFAPGDTRLVAYVVPAADELPAEQALRALLRKSLPESMIPAVFVAIPTLPVSSNGKLDRKRLPPPPLRRRTGTAYAAPRTAVEEIVAGIYSRLLAIPRVGVYDDFFELGGHSLLAMQLASRIQDIFLVVFPLRQIFERSHVAALAEAIESDLRSGIAMPPPVSAARREGRLPLSFAQQRLWFLDQLAPGSSYNCAGALRLHGPLDSAALQRSITLLLARHEILRTIFRETEGQTEQIVLRPGEFDLELAGSLDYADALRLAAEHARRPFDLTSGPLIRTALIRLDDDDHILLLSLHHIVSDGWSLGLLFRELTDIYQSVRAGSVPALPPLSIQYADYAVWQRRWIAGEAFEHQLAYWKRQLEEAPELSSFPPDRPRPAAGTARGARLLVHVNPALSGEIRAYSRREGVTVFMTLLGALQLLLYRHTGQTDVVVGSPIAGRNRVELEGIIGFFINTLALRCNLSGDPPWRHFIARVREAVLGAYANHDIPFEQIVAEVRPERTLSHAPLFQVMFDYLDASIQAPEFLGLRSEPLDIDSGTAKFDFTLTLGDSPDGFRGSIEYATDLFDSGTIARLAQQLEILLDGIVRNPENRLSQLPLMHDGERRWILSSLTGSGPDRADPLVLNLFDACARDLPDRVALVAEDEHITYGELDRRATRLARRLRTVGAVPEMPVGIYLEKCPDMVIGIFAVLKAGAAYVPLDRDQSRAFHLRQHPLPILVTRTAYLSEVSGAARDIVCLDVEDAGACNGVASNWPAEPDSLAYVIFTSGSTGEPKSVMVTHRALASAFRSWEQAYSLSSGVSRHLQMANPSFDVFTGDLVRALCSGGALVLCPRDTLVDPEELHALIVREQIDCAEFLPAVLRELIALGKPLDSLAVVIAGASVLDTADYQQLRRALGTHAQVFNSYGCAEATIDSTLFTGDAESTVPIGVPIDNTRVYLLDVRYEPVPVGVGGEIYLGGAGLARGYLGRPELTAERWLPDPFSGRLGARLYRTGDRGRWNAHGQIEYLGRVDQQVKIRGFRIEPGEIEAVLCTHPAIKEAAVVARQGRLVAYVSGGEAPTEALRRYLSERLPDYMLPGLIVPLAQLPRTPNGKLDRRALPEPEHRPTCGAGAAHCGGSRTGADLEPHAGSRARGRRRELLPVGRGFHSEHPDRGAGPAGGSAGDGAPDVPASEHCRTGGGRGAGGGLRGRAG